MLQAEVRGDDRPQFTMRLARNVAEVRAAQRLRYRVFAEEMGAAVPGREQGIDCDLYDAYCNHLIVRDEACGEVIGTYRLLNGAQAKRAGGFYSDQEFDLRAVARLREVTVEAGRACIHPAYRNGHVLAMLWSGITDYMLRGNYEYLIGCASVGLADGGAHARQVYRTLARSHLSPEEYRVAPRRAWSAVVSRDDGTDDTLPPLLKGYRRLGAYLCGEPAWDPDFDSADFFLLLPMARLDARYLKRLTRH